MIIFDLICAHNHIFEGWFSSSKDYETQKEKKLLLCPSCGSEDIKKSIMAPNIGLKTNQKKISPQQSLQQSAPQSMTQAAPHIASHTEAQPIAADSKPDPSDAPITNQNKAAIEEAAKALAKVQEEALKDSIWVGTKFSQEARSMHYGEADKRQIHGHATQKEAHELQEEGIEIAALPLPYIPPDLKN